MCILGNISRGLPFQNLGLKRRKPKAKIAVENWKRRQQGEWMLAGLFAEPSSKQILGGLLTGIG